MSRRISSHNLGATKASKFLIIYKDRVIYSHQGFFLVMFNQIFKKQVREIDLFVEADITVIESSTKV